MRLFFAFLFITCAIHAQDLRTLIAQGEALDSQMKTQEALTVFLQAEKLEPNNSLVLSRIAKQYGESMTDTTDQEKKLELGNKALGYAKRAVAVDANSSLAQLSLAVCYGRLALIESNKTKIAYSRLIKEHADIAAKLDPNNDLCWHMLGVWTHGMADLNPILRSIAGIIYGKLPTAKNEDAVKYFQKAIALNPDRLGNHVELGKTYLSMGRKAEAKAEFETALSMPNRLRDDPEAKRVTKQLLDNL